MYKLKPPPEKLSPLSQQAPLKIEILSRPPFLQIWLKAQTPCSRKGGGGGEGGAHYVTRKNFYKNFQVSNWKFDNILCNLVF